MSPKKLIIPALILAVLVAAGVVKSVGSVRRERAEKARVSGPAIVLNRDLAAAFVTRITLSRGGDADQKVVLRKDEATGQWVVESRYGVRAKSGQIDPLLKDLTAIQGEPVADEKEVLGDYKLTDDLAFRIRLEGAQAQTLSDLFLSPLRPGGTRNFVRSADSNTVVSTNTDILGTLGIFTDKDKIKPDDFVDHRMIVMDTTHLLRVELATEKSGPIALVKTPKTGDKPEVWRLGEGDSAPELDTGKVTNDFLYVVNNFYAGAVLDSAGADHGFGEKPWVRFQLSSGQRPDHWELYVGKRLKDKQAYPVKVMPGGVVYELADRHLEPQLKKDKDTFLKAKTA